MYTCVSKKCFIYLLIFDLILIGTNVATVNNVRKGGCMYYIFVSFMCIRFSHHVTISVTFRLTKNK